MVLFHRLWSPGVGRTVKAVGVGHDTDALTPRHSRSGSARLAEAGVCAWYRDRGRQLLSRRSIPRAGADLAAPTTSTGWDAPLGIRSGNPAHLCSATNRCGNDPVSAGLGRLATGFVAIFTSRRCAKCLAGPAKVIDGDTIVVAGQLVRLHGIDAPELDQTFQWRGQQMGCGAMSLAALEALTAGVKVRCEVVERDRHGRLVAKVYSPNGLDISRRLVLAGWALATSGTRRTTSIPRTRPAKPSAGCGGAPS